MRNITKIISLVIVVALVATLAVAFTGCNNTKEQGMEDFPAMINALNTKAIDGYVAEEPGAIENCASNPNFTYIHLVNNSTGFTASEEDTAIAVGVKKGSALTAQINTALAAITQAQRDAMMATAIAYATGNNVTEGSDDETTGSVSGDDKLYVGLECAYAPFNFTQLDDANGAVPIYNPNYKRISGYANGYDVMIAKAIATALGKELVIVKQEWDALIPSLKAGTINMIIAGMSPTADRKESIDFSDAYYTSQLVVRKDGAYAGAKSLDDVKGAKLTAQQVTFHLDALNAWLAANK